MRNIKYIHPQKGFQESFLHSPADIVIGGGSAGVGKSFALLLDYNRYSGINHWHGVVFRRLSTQITAAGGLWDTSTDLFSKFGLENRPKPNESKHRWKFPSGASLQFSHLQYEKDKIGWQGSQISYLGWDELTHFTRSQFFYLLTRNRGISGKTPRCRATCNPEGKGWVKDLVSWFLYPDDYEDQAKAGYPIPERVGKLRYFTKYKAKLIWGNNPIEVLEQLPADIAIEYDFNSIKCLTFIPGRLEENKALLALDPSYKANLLTQDEDKVESLYRGRWLHIEKDYLKLYDYRALIGLFENAYVSRAKTYMTCDLAFEGADKFVVGIWSGFRLERIFSYEKTDGPEVYNIIKRLAKQFRVPSNHIIIDTGGTGNPFKGFFKNAYHFQGNSKAEDVEGKPQNYFNLRSQCFFMLKSYINNYKMFANVADETTIDIILEELDAIKRVEKSLKLRVIPKAEIRSEIGRSPDYADMISMIMVVLLPSFIRKGGNAHTSTII